jgi:DNA-binding transcriptional LysR family regulator
MTMALSQLQLEAFSEINRVGSFTAAGLSLGLTQSALSHRIRNLEADLETAVFVRIGNKVRLTEAGTRLLKFCQVQMQAEAEFISDIKPSRTTALSGRLRIGGMSSVMRSLVLTSISGFLRENPGVTLEFLVREISEIPVLLTSGEVDFVVTSSRLEISGLHEELLGYEENVLVQSTKKHSQKDVYLDHDQNDQTTLDFLKAQGQKKINIRRSFLDDVYGLVDAVVEGLGRAVVPRHIAEASKGIEIIKTQKSLFHAVYLYYYEQPYYTKLHLKTQATLLSQLQPKLKSR